MDEPTNLKDAVGMFRRLAPESREAVVSALENEEPAADFQTLAARVAQATSADAKFLAVFLRGLSNLVRLTVRDQDLGRMLARFLVVDAASSSPDESFEQQVFRLLLCERSIGLTAKAQTILWGHGRVLKSSHSIAQVRPIFFEDLAVNSDVGVIVHELRLEFQEDGNVRSLCVALDAPRIAQMIDVLERSLRKEASIRSAERMKYLQPQSEQPL